MGGNIFSSLRFHGNAMVTDKPKPGDRHPAIVTAAIVLLVCTATAADTDVRAFVGTWKENPAKSRHAMSGALTYTFTEEPGGFVSIVRANTPLHDRARFDGKDYPSSGSPGATVSWTKVSDTQFENTIKRNGALLATARWTVSEGGSHLTQETTPVRKNGDSGTGTIEYVRISGARNSLFGV